MIEVVQLDSQQLAGNVIGDPSRRDLVVYLPPSYPTVPKTVPGRVPPARVRPACHGLERGSVGAKRRAAPADPGRHRRCDSQLRRRGDDRGHARRLEPLRLQSVGGLPRERQLRAVRHTRDCFVRGPDLSNDPRTGEPGRVRHLIRRPGCLASRLAQSRCIRRHGAAVGRFILRVHAQAVVLPFLHLALSGGSRMARSTGT